MLGIVPMRRHQIANQMVTLPSPTFGNPKSSIRLTSSAAWLASFFHRLTWRAHYRLAAVAFRHVLARKQSKYRDLISWLDGLVETSEAKSAVERLRMRRVVREGEKVFRDFQY